MNLVLHSLLALGLVALMRTYDDAAILALAGCGWLGVALAARTGPLRPSARGDALPAQAASLVEIAVRLLAGLVTAFLIYGLAEQILTLPDQLRRPPSDGDRALAAAIAGWTIATAWLLMAIAPMLVRGWSGRRPADAVPIWPAVQGLLGAALAGAPTALIWTEYGDAWAQGWLDRRDLIEGLPLLAPAALAIVAGVELWRRSLTARPASRPGLLRAVMLGGFAAASIQAIAMTAELLRVARLPQPAFTDGSLEAGGAFLIGQSLAWMAATWRLKRTPEAGPPHALLACFILLVSMLLATIPAVTVMSAAEWSALVALVMAAPLLGGVILSQTLVVWLVRTVAGGPGGRGNVSLTLPPQG